MFTRKTMCAALLGTSVVTAPAIAGPFFLDPGFDGGSSPDSDTRTAPINELGFTGTYATSFYFGDPSAIGTDVLDTNIDSVMIANGFASGARTNILGAPVDNGNLSPDGEFFFPPDPAGLNIDTLNTQGGSSDFEGFVDGVATSYGDLSVVDLGPPIVLSEPAWGLTYQYVLEGETTATGVEYTDGFFNVFYEDGGAPVQVLRIEVTGSSLNLANLDIFGRVSFDFDGMGAVDDTGGSAFIQNLFVDVETDMTFYDLWLEDPSAEIVRFTLDTNVNPPLPEADQLVCGDLGTDALLADCESPLIRQTSLDGSVAFQVVPSPGTLGLAGIALAALGWRRRTRR